MKRSLFFLITASYVAVTLSFFWFLLPVIGSATFDRDNLLVNWMLAWDMHAITHFPLKLLDANIFFPHSHTLLYSELLLSQSILALPIYLVSKNSLLAYNIWILLSYILAALGAYLLAYYYTKHSYASWIAGLIFGFATYRIISIHHFQNLSIFWIPFAVLCWQKYFDTSKRRYLVATVLLFVGQAWASWYNGAFLGFFLLYLLCWHFKTVRENFRTWMNDLLLGAILTAILIGPFAIAYMQFRASQNATYSLGETILYSADLGGYLLPSPFSIPARIIAWVGITKERWLENINFLGTAPLLFLLYFVAIRRIKILDRAYRMYLWGISLFALLSFGPALHLFDKTLKVPLPFLAIHAIPIFQFIRVPSRMAILVLLCLAMVTAYMIRSIHIQRAWLRIGLAVILPVSILLDGYDATIQDHLLKNIHCPEIYTDVKTTTSVRAIVELPLRADPFETAEYMFDSRCHLKPIFNGYSGYLPSDYAFVSSVISAFPDPVSVDYLSSLGISHAVVHLDLVKNSEEFRSAIQRNPELSIVSEQGSDMLVKLNVLRQPEILYATDFGIYESNPQSIQIEKDRVIQQSTIGGRTFDGIYGQMEGNRLIYHDLSLENSATLSIALQGQVYSDRDDLRIRIIDSNGKIFSEQSMDLSGIDEWEIVDISLPETYKKVSVEMQFLPQQFPDRVFLNTLVLYRQ
ncbi:MAG: hypothetical protein HYZ08_02545 [Candidatus Kerfeldbacteria bacterium]|nr:hypothetical protein [Candidatus Kerfeldbacteria bacterium]